MQYHYLPNNCDYFVPPYQPSFDDIRQYYPQFYPAHVISTNHEQPPTYQFNQENCHYPLELTHPHHENSREVKNMEYTTPNSELADTPLVSETAATPETVLFPIHLTNGGSSSAIVSLAQDHDVTTTDQKVPPILKVTCEICGRIFTKRSYYLQHHKAVHSGKQCRCDTCGKYFINKEILAEHSLKHVNKSYKCTSCPRKFRHKHDMLVHSYSHVGGRFFCEFCNKGFNRIDHLNNHKKICRLSPIEWLVSSCVLVFRGPGTNLNNPPLVDT